MAIDMSLPQRLALLKGIESKPDAEKKADMWRI